MVSDDVDVLVVMATYRRPEFLAEAIRSSLAQSGATKAIFVVDDCPDGSAKATVEALGAPTVSYLRNPSPCSGGPSRVRNFGFAEAARRGVRARFVHYLDDDVVVPEGHYATVRQAFNANPDAGVVFGNLQAFTQLVAEPERRARQQAHMCGFQGILDRTARQARSYRDIGKRLASPTLARMLYRQHALFGPPMFYCGCCIIRYEHAVALGGFAETVRLTEDLRYFGLAVHRYGAASLDRVACHYRLSDISLTRSLVITPEQAAAEAREMQDAQRQWQIELRRDLGPARYYAIKSVYKLGTRPLIDRVLQPMLMRTGSA